MPIRIDMNGEPEIVAAKTGTVGQQLAAEIVAPKLPVLTFSDCVRELLAKYEQPATIVIDTKQRRVYATTDPTKANQLKTHVASKAADTAELAPDPGQQGRALTWSGDASGLPNQTRQNIAAAIAPAKPRRSVESLVSAILSAPYESEDDVPVVVVDQNTGLVWVSDVKEERAALEGLLNGVSPSADMVTLRIDGQAVEVPNAPAPKLIFEGAAVPPQN